MGLHCTSIRFGFYLIHVQCTSLINCMVHGEYFSQLIYFMQCLLYGEKCSQQWDSHGLPNFVARKQNWFTVHVKNNPHVSFHIHVTLPWHISLLLEAHYSMNKEESSNSLILKKIQIREWDKRGPLDIYTIGEVNIPCQPVWPALSAISRSGKRSENHGFFGY
jgi:hypothetical protein